jgi:hypothetical protein
MFSQLKGFTARLGFIIRKTIWKDVHFESVIQDDERNSERIKKKMASLPLTHNRFEGVLIN